MVQVFVNIIGNALSYTPGGGKVTVSGKTGDGRAEVTVADTGRGLSPQQREMVFERFYRADRSVPGGTGIGLTIARDIVRRHGGDIQVSSPGPGAGTSFVVAIPTDPKPGMSP